MSHIVRFLAVIVRWGYLCQLYYLDAQGYLCQLYYLDAQQII